MILTAVLIQLTFYREIKLGPLLGTTKTTLLKLSTTTHPTFLTLYEKKVFLQGCGMLDLPLSLDEIHTANLAGHQRAHRRESGLKGGFLWWFDRQFSLLYRFSSNLLSSKENISSGASKKIKTS